MKRGLRSQFQLQVLLYGLSRHSLSTRASVDGLRANRKLSPLFGTWPKLKLELDTPPRCRLAYFTPPSFPEGLITLFRYSTASEGTQNVSSKS